MTEINIKRKMKSREIADVLRRQIIARKLAPGTPVMSTTQIAEHYQVALMTAHKVLDQLEQEDLIYRRRGSGSFVKKPKSGKKFLIGCAVSQDVGPRNTPYGILVSVFADTVLKYFKQQGCSIRLLPYTDFCRPEYWKQLDGVLISSGFIDQTTEKFIRSLRLPTVLMGSEYQLDLPFSQVLPDLNTGLEEVFRRISSDSYRELIVLHLPHRNSEARLKAFCTAARHAGYRPEQIKAYAISEYESYRLGCRLAEDIHGKLIFSCSDFISFSFLDALIENGLTYGQDFDLIGFDNLEGKGICPYTRPILTAIDYSHVKLATTAAQLLLSSIRHPKSNELYQIIKIPTRMIIRESALTPRRTL